MKDEEMAEEYCNHLQSEMLAYTPENPRQQRTVSLLDVEEAFLAGLKAGRPQWHKMDYNDEKSFENIPRYIELLTKYSCGLFEAHCINKWTGDHWCEHSYGVIAWCEIPTFDKE